MSNILIIKHGSLGDIAQASGAIQDIFDNHIYGTADYISSIKDALEIIGLGLKEKRNPNLSAQYFGFIAIKENEKIIIKMVEPDSIADKNGVAPGDEITLVDGERRDSLKDYLKDCKNEVSFSIKKKFSEEVIKLAIGNHYQLLELVKKESATKEQQNLRKIWSS